MEDLPDPLTEATTALDAAHARIAELEAQLTQSQAIRDIPVIAGSAEQVRNSRLADILETLDDVLISVTLPDRTIEYISPNFEKVIGYPFAKFSDPDFYKKILHPEDREVMIRSKKKTPQEGVSDSLHRIILPDGQIRWLRRHSKMTYDSQQQAVRLDELIRDVSGHLEANQKLLQFGQQLARSEEKFSHIFAISPDSMMISTINQGIILDVNEAYIRDHGYSREELIGKNIYDMGVVPDEPSQMVIHEAIVRQGYATGIEIDYKTRSGEARIGLMSTAAIEINNEPCIISVMKDITERKQTEAREQAAAQKLRAVLDAVNILLGIDDHDAFFRCVVELGHEKLNLERCGLMLFDPVTKTFVGCYGTDDQRRIINERDFQYPITGAEWKTLDDFQTNAQQWIMIPDFALGYWDGQQRQEIRRGWIVVTPILNNGVPIAMITNDTALSGAPVDPFQQEKLALYASLVGQIWARKQNDQLLRDSEAKYRALVEGIDAIILIFDTEGNALFANQKAIHTLGWQGIDPVGKPMDTLFAAPIAKTQIRMIRQIVKTGETVIRDVPGLIPHEGRWFRFICQPIMDPGGTIVRRVMVSAIDVTLIKNAEQALFSQTVELEKRVAERTAELNQTKNRLETIFNHSGDGVILLDVERGIQQGNYMFEQLFQLEQDSYHGWSLRQLVHPDDVPLLDDVIQSVANHQEARRAELRLKTRLGAVVDVEINLSPINQSEEAATYLVGIIRDVRERKQAQQALAEERNLLRAVIDAVPDFIYVKDTHKRMLINNVAHAHFLGKDDPAELVGKTDSDYLPPAFSVSAAADEDAVLRTGQPRIDIEEDVSGIDSKLTWVSTTKTPLRDLQGTVIGLVGITRDISGRKAAAQALERALAQEKEVAELRARFISTASHEFRTPLATMMAAAESLEAYRARMTDEQIEQRLVKIRNQGNRLKGIIDEVLIISRMQSGKVVFEPTLLDLDAFCRDAISDFENRPDIDHDIRYTCSAQPLMAWIDNKLLQPALSNLIANAIKYSPVNKHIFITVDADDDLVSIQVRDTGIGIPEADLDHLFESFHRASNVGPIPGTGLGLVITKQSIELHGGSIQVVSAVDQGTTFTVRLPNYNLPTYDRRHWVQPVVPDQSGV